LSPTSNIGYNRLIDGSLPVLDMPDRPLRTEYCISLW
jgi:hypothetical protein